jgi:hypothetical protein
MFANLANADRRVWIYLFGMSISSSVICWGMFLWLLRRIGAQASLYAFLVPCIALALGAAVNHEWSGVSGIMIAIQLVGVLIVLIGMGMVMMKDLGKFKESMEKKGLETYVAASVMSVHSVEEVLVEQGVADDEFDLNSKSKGSTEYESLVGLKVFEEAVPLISEDAIPVSSAKRRNYGAVQK